MKTQHTVCSILAKIEEHRRDVPPKTSLSLTLGEAKEFIVLQDEHIKALETALRLLGAVAKGSGSGDERLQRISSIVELLPKGDE